MALVVLTGGARSGKSGTAARLAGAHAGPVFVAVAGVGDGDQEMTARIERHREDRPASWTTLEVAGQAMAAWLPGVPADACLVVDCLGTLLSALLFDDATTPTEDAAEAIASGVVEALLARTGNTIVVTNEVGMGVVPVSESGRLFRDALGRANARLTDAADAAYLVVAGRAFDLTALPRDAAWPSR